MKISCTKLLSGLAFAAFFFLAPAVHAQKGTLDDIRFLEGQWLGTFNGGPIEASWTAPAGDNIIGYIRMLKNNTATMYELFVIEQSDKGPVVMVKHFKHGLVALEEKDQFDLYTFVSAQKNEAIFEKDHELVRIRYERRSPTQLVIQRGAYHDDKWDFADLFVFDKIP